MVVQMEAFLQLAGNLVTDLLDLAHAASVALLPANPSSGARAAAVRNR